jgi:diadenosine tetraphosphate (Ap4A) HIT family hydrolase
METKHFKILISDDQSYFGRLVILLKRPCESLSQVKQEEWEDFSNIVKKLESFFTKTYKATMFNWSCLMNEAAKRGEKTQVHFHFRPRYKKQIQVNGEVFRDPNFGFHYISTNTGLSRNASSSVQKDLSKKLHALFA